MASSINLLPKSLVEGDKKLSKLALVQKLSFILLGTTLMTLLAVVILRVHQKNQLEQTTRSLNEAQAQIDKLQDKSTQLLALKTELDSVQNLVGADQKRKALFALVAFLSGPEVAVSEVTVGKDNNTVVTASSKSLLAINQLVVDLSNPQKNAGIVSRVELEGLNLGRDSTYKFGLKITPK